MTDHSADEGSAMSVLIHGWRVQQHNGRCSGMLTRPGTCEISRRGDRYRLVSMARVTASIDEVFSFFSYAGNLDRLTPRFLRFQILTPGPMAMGAGTLIDYRLQIHGVPIRWQSEITAWDPPCRFVDEQRRGPYRLWIHEHCFRRIGGETEITDRVDYAVPGGRLVHRLFVRRDLARIFDYRRKRLTEYFSKRELPLALRENEPAVEATSASKPFVGIAK